MARAFFSLDFRWALFGCSTPTRFDGGMRIGKEIIQTDPLPEMSRNVAVCQGNEQNAKRTQSTPCRLLGSQFGSQWDEAIAWNCSRRGCFLARRLHRHAGFGIIGPTNSLVDSTRALPSKNNLPRSVPGRARIVFRG